MNKCTSWLGHKFEPRYTFTVSPDHELKLGPMRGYGSVSAEDIIRSFQSKTYERDVCVRCGEVIERAAIQPANGG